MMPKNLISVKTPKIGEWSDIINTNDNYNFDTNWMKLYVPLKTLRFSVKALSNAHIRLSPTPDHNNENFYEITLGGRHCTNSCIKVKKDFNPI